MHAQSYLTTPSPANRADGPLSEIRAHGLLGVIKATGGTIVDRSHATPCPACGEEHASRNDRRRRPVHFDARTGAWACQWCDAKGDAVRWLEFATLGRRATSPDDWKAVIEAGRSHGLVSGAHEPVTAPRPLRRADPLPERQRPQERPSEARAVWSDATCPGPVPELLAWGASRGWTGPEVMRLGGWGMLGYLDGRGALPGWASFRGRTWVDLGYRAAVPGYDPHGVLVELRARYTGTGPAPDGRSKLAAKGALLASTVWAPCPVMRALLRAGPGARPGLLESADGWPVQWSSGAIMLCEGETDLLALAVALHRDGRHPTGEGWPALGSYTSGTWTDEIAARIPDCAEVTIFPDADERGQGLAMARKVRDTFTRRRMRARIVDVAALAGRKEAA